MLFRLKLRWWTALAALVVLCGCALLSRRGLPHPTPFGEARHLVNGVMAAGVMLCIDGAIHGVAVLAAGRAYLDRFQQLHATFAAQSWDAIACGSLLAGLGEEIVFRGLDARPAWLFVSAVAFGVCHRCREHAWYFTLWAVWEGIALGALVVATGVLIPAMVAHTVHDLLGFAYFRRLNHALNAAEARGEGHRHGGAAA